MRVSDILTAAFVAPLVAAHGGIAGAPKIFGMAPNDIAALKSRNILGGHVARPARAVHSSPLQARQDGRCGKDFGCAVCPEGSCCSGSGYCGLNLLDTICYMLTFIQVGKGRTIARHPIAISSMGQAPMLTSFLLGEPLVMFPDQR